MDQARVPVMDRGFLFGDAVYEVIPFFYGVGFRLDQHLQRLQHSLDAVGIVLEQDWPTLFQRLIEQNPAPHQAIYLQISRGVMPQRTLRYPDQLEPTVFAYSYPIDMALEQPLDRIEPVSAVTVADQRWGRCDIKSTGLLANVLAARQAQDRGAQEALQVRQGYLTEGASCNLFVIERGVIYTPSMDNQILGGTTRSLVLELARQAGIDCIEEPVKSTRLRSADEVWLSSSSRGVVPVIEVDGHPVGNGDPGPVWRQMAQLFQQFGQQMLAGE
jgi:D-alanine transaminase